MEIKKKYMQQFVIGDIDVINISLTDRLEAQEAKLEKNVMTPLWHDVVLESTEDHKFLNINQTFESPTALTKNLPQICDIIKGGDYGLGDDDWNVNLVFIGTKSNKAVDNLYDKLISQESTSSRYGWRIEKLTGDNTNNKEAHKKVKKAIKEEKLTGRNRPILLLANKLARRSFSVGQISRVILFKDSNANDSDYQAFMRGGTPFGNKTTFDVIRVSFYDSNAEPDPLEKLLALQDLNPDPKANENQDNKEKNLNRVKETFRFQSVIKTTMTADKIEAQKLDMNNKALTMLIDSTKNIKDSVELTAIELVDMSNLKLNNKFSGIFKNIQKIIQSELTTKKGTSGGTGGGGTGGTGGVSKQRLKALDGYSYMLNMMPYVLSYAYGRDYTFKEFLNNYQDFIQDYFYINLKDFDNNLLIPNFKYRLKIIFENKRNTPMYEEHIYELYASAFNGGFNENY